MEITLAPEVLFKLGSFAVTNTLLTFVIVVLIILGIFFLVNARYSYEKPGTLQILLEMMVSALYGVIRDILGEERGKKLFGFLFTFFILIIMSNWFGLLPFVPSVVVKRDPVEPAAQTQTSDAQAAPAQGTQSQDSTASTTTSTNCTDIKKCYLTTSGLQNFDNGAKIFRAPTTDLSMAVALALIAVITYHVLGYRELKGEYIKKYFNFSNPLNATVGLLELVSEFSKILSFSFRLFGNIFAGELLLAVITGITFGVATLPFLLLEIFVGFIQALVFLMLTSVFIALAVTGHEHEPATH